MQILKEREIDIAEDTTYLQTCIDEDICATVMDASDLRDLKDFVKKQASKRFDNISRKKNVDFVC